MQKVSTAVLSTLSFVTAVALSPYMVRLVEWFVGHFPGDSAWVRPVAWLVLVAVLFSLALGLSAVWQKMVRYRSAKRGKRRLAQERTMLRALDKLLAEFARLVSRFYMELEQEKSPDSDSLTQHIATDDVCYDALRIIRLGPGVSMAHLANGYWTEREMADTTWQHYEVELRYPLRGSGTAKDRISKAKYGARCVDLLTSRMRDLMKARM